jgi:hypothetical protein
MTTAQPRPYVRAPRPGPPAGPAYPQTMREISFPQLGARDLDGREMTLPAGLPGEWNVVIIAFQRQQQELVDSWAPWLAERAAVTPWLRFAELPAIGLQWQPARPATADGLTAALAGLPEHTAAAPAAGPGAGQFEMAFDPRFRLPLAALGVTPVTAHVTVTADRLVACFGPWTCRTTPANVRAVDIAGPYRWSRVIGPRLSLADHGLTFGTTPARGACLLLREPVPGIDPLGVIRHPGLTLTVACPERFAVTVRHYAGPARARGRRTRMSTPSARRPRLAWSPRQPDT